MSSSRTAVVTGGAGGIGDVLVHAAAAFDQAELRDVELKSWRRVQAVNVEAAVLLADVTGLTRGLAAALGGDGITVNAVAPGLTRTPAAEEGIEREAFEEVRRGQAVPKTLTAEDTAAAVCSDAAAITGQTLNVDGGLIFH